HPNRQLKSPSRIFRESRLASLRPLEIITTMPGGETETRYGFANWTLGGSALAGTFFADKDQRVDMTTAEAKPFGKLRRLGLEYKLSIQALKEVDTIALHGDLSTDSLLDLSVSNGPRMAKLFHFHDLELLRPEAGLIVSERRSEVHIDLSKFIAKSLMGRMTRIKPATIISFVAYTRQGGNLVVQNDGEAQAVPSGSSFTLSLADRSVPVYTTRD
ncbi:MAG TPA: hypothetical protein VFL85_00505, partial [Candidatus Saccharimonadales bacterium]|nr:hypothetical protein [Candidatus Saccharimonadales bacterium]